MARSDSEVSIIVEEDVSEPGEVTREAALESNVTDVLGAKVWLHITYEAFTNCHLNDQISS